MIKAPEGNKYCFKACETHQVCECRMRQLSPLTPETKGIIVKSKVEQLQQQNDELRKALEELIYACTGEQEDEEELEKALGKTVVNYIMAGKQALSNNPKL